MAKKIKPKQTIAQKMREIKRNEQAAYSKRTKYLADTQTAHL